MKVKECPDCGGYVPIEWGQCQNCGHKFPVIPKPSNQPAASPIPNDIQQNQNSHKKMVLIIFSIIVTVVLILVIVLALGLIGAPKDTVSPTITIVAPTNEQTYYSVEINVTLSGTASDNVGLTSITWSSNFGGYGTVVGTSSWSIPSVSIDQGSVIITVIARDAAGNSGSDSITLIFDDQSPTATITWPTTEPTFSTSSSSIDLEGVLSDNIGVSSVTWSNDRGGSGSATILSNNWSISSISLASGINVITVSAFDLAGNSPGVAVITIDYTPPDTTSPLITITSPTSELYYSTESSTIAISGTASDNIKVTSVTWSNDRGGSGIALGNESWSIPSISLKSGVNIITLSAFDDAGNLPGTDTLFVTYSPPIVDIHFDGHGDDITQMFDLTAGVAIFQMTHDGSSNFAIWLETSAGVKKELLVNEIGTYQGSTLVGVTSTGYLVVPGRYYLAVTADGDWTVTISQPHPISAAGLPQTFTGTSDKVPYPFTLTAGAIKFQMTYKGSSNFAVILYDANGNYIDLLANEIGDYSGSTTVGVTGTGIYYLCVLGIGNWSITITHL